MEPGSFQNFLMFVYNLHPKLYRFHIPRKRCRWKLNETFSTKIYLLYLTSRVLATQGSFANEGKSLEVGASRESRVIVKQQYKGSVSTPLYSQNSRISVHVVRYFEGHIKIY